MQHISEKVVFMNNRTAIPNSSLASTLVRDFNKHEKNGQRAYLAFAARELVERARHGDLEAGAFVRKIELGKFGYVETYGAKLMLQGAQHDFELENTSSSRKNPLAGRISEVAGKIVKTLVESRMSGPEEVFSSYWWSCNPPRLEISAKYSRQISEISSILASELGGRVISEPHILGRKEWALENQYGVSDLVAGNGLNGERDARQRFWLNLCGATKADADAVKELIADLQKNTLSWRVGLARSLLELFVKDGVIPESSLKSASFISKGYDASMDIAISADFSGTVLPRHIAALSREFGSIRTRDYDPGETHWFQTLWEGEQVREPYDPGTWNPSLEVRAGKDGKYGLLKLNLGRLPFHSEEPLREYIWGANAQK